jgi:hypothetical protein
MNRLSKVVAVASVVGASAMSMQPAAASWFGWGPVGFGWGPRPVPAAALVPPPPYLWRVRYGVPPYGAMPPVPPPASQHAAPQAPSAEKAPAAQSAPAPEKSEAKTQ